MSRDMRKKKKTDIGGTGTPSSCTRERPALTPGAVSQALDDGGVGHAAALAHRLEAPAPAGALELVRAGCT